MKTPKARSAVFDQNDHAAQFPSYCRSGFTPRFGIIPNKRHVISDITCRTSRRKGAPTSDQAGAGFERSEPKRRNSHRINFLGLIAPALLGVFLFLDQSRACAADDTIKPQAPSSAVPVVVRPAAASPYAGFDTFGIIGERNIFNPNRVGRTPRSANTPPPMTDTLSLVGTMNYEKGLFAFFDGSQPGFRQALHLGGTITGFTVTGIDSNSVELTRDGQKIPLKIGQQLRRPVGGDWTVLSMDAVQRNTEVATTAAAVRADDTGAPPTIPANASDTLKRLMEKRMNQLKQ